MAGISSENLYWFAARPDLSSRYELGVLDGDTVDCIVDVGWRMTTAQRLRLLRLNTPELRRGSAKSRQDGVEARQYVVGWMKQAMVDAGEHPWPLIIRTFKADAFGRYLAEVHRRSDGASLNDELLGNGHAVPFVKR